MSTIKPWCDKKSAPSSGMLVFANMKCHLYLLPFRCIVLEVVPKVGMVVPFAAVSVRADLMSGNCCWYVDAGMIETQAPVSTKYLV